MTLQTQFDTSPILVNIILTQQERVKCPHYDKQRNVSHRSIGTRQARQIKSRECFIKDLKGQKLPSYPWKKRKVKVYP